MRTAKISELKARLSAHIEYVKRGEEVLILDRNKPVARLVPAQAAEDEDAEMRRLIDMGIILPPRDPEAESNFVPSPAGDKPISQETMNRIWEEERADR
jgi:prevent-host-death family protein